MYWFGSTPKQTRSSFVNWDDKELDMAKILKDYKLKGFEFGRWLNEDDRYDFLIGAKQSLEDLALLLDTKNIGIESQVGIAFGARGRGGFAIAHYEPGFNMINLTKTKGEHSLAHEYGHALDFNIGTYVDQNKDFCALSGGRSMAAWPEKNTGGTCRLLMRKLIYDIKHTQSFARLKDKGDYWHYNTEVFARFFEQWCCYKLREKKISNAFLTKSWSHYIGAKIYLTETDFKKVLPVADRLMKNLSLTLNGKPTETAVPLEITNPEKVKKAPVKKEPKKKAAPKKAVTKKVVTPKAPEKKAAAAPKPKKAAAKKAAPKKKAALQLNLF